MTALKEAVESLNRKVSDRSVVMAAARAYINEAQQMVDGLLLDAVKAKTVQVGMIWQVFELREEHDAAGISVLWRFHLDSVWQVFVLLF